MPGIPPPLGAFGCFFIESVQTTPSAIQLGVSINLVSDDDPGVTFEASGTASSSRVGCERFPLDTPANAFSFCMQRNGCTNAFIVGNSPNDEPAPFIMVGQQAFCVATVDLSIVGGGSGKAELFVIAVGSDVALAANVYGGGFFFEPDTLPATHYTFRTWSELIGSTTVNLTVSGWSGTASFNFLVT